MNRDEADQPSEGREQHAVAPAGEAPDVDDASQPGPETIERVRALADRARESTQRASDRESEVERIGLKASLRLSEIEKKTIPETFAEEIANTRKWASRTIVFTFCGVAVLACLAILTMALHDDALSEKLVERMLKFLQGVLLPAVAVVLGFYFGSSSNR